MQFKLVKSEAADRESQPQRGWFVEDEEASALAIDLGSHVQIGAYGEFGFAMLTVPKEGDWDHQLIPVYQGDQLELL